jgi:NADP-dependent 3-hydroxy acid dehydrogenase YdfG
MPRIGIGQCGLSMTSTSLPVLLVLGAGPGLGMSVAHRFGAEGYAVALVSRSAARHADYLQSLTEAGVEAAAFAADAADPKQLRAAVDAARTRFGRIDVGYYGPAAFGQLSGDITKLDSAGAEAALRSVVPAVDFASLLLPELTERGDLHKAILAALNQLAASAGTLNPDDLADTVWRLYTERNDAEAVVSAMGR